MSAIEETACPICGPSNISGVSEFRSSGSFPIVSCNGCGLLFVSPRPATNNIEKHFEGDFVVSAEAVEKRFVTIRQPTLIRTANRIRKLFRSGGDLLDIGSASGYFLSLFMGSNWRLQGIEPSRVAAEYARSHFGLKIHNGFLGELKFDEATFDAITSLDAFYYHPEPNKDLAIISAILKPGGIFAVEIPGLNFRFLKECLCRGCQLNPNVHLFFYSRKTFSLLASKHSLALIRSYPEHAPEPAGMHLKLLNMLFSSAAGLAYRISSGVLNIAPKELLIFRKL